MHSQQQTRLGDPLISPEYIAARRVLLDALEALREHLDNLILVGSQAIYLNTGAFAFHVPPMTTDADLALNTHRLAPSPEIAQTLIDAGFTPSSNPGHWAGAMDVCVDIMIVPYQSGTTSKTARSARIPPHAKSVGRIAKGLEPSLVDNAIHSVASFEADDPRSFHLRVANPAASLIAKAIKVSERENDSFRQPGRLRAKDSLDMFRILQSIDTCVLVEGLNEHRKHPEVASVSAEGMSFIKAEGASPTALLPRLASEAAFGDPTVAPAFAALVCALVDASEV